MEPIDTRPTCYASDFADYRLHLIWTAPPDMVSEETEYGCCITGIQADSIAAQNAALVCGLILQMVRRVRAFE